MIQYNWIISKIWKNIVIYNHVIIRAGISMQCKLLKNAKMSWENEKFIIIMILNVINIFSAFNRA